MNHECTLDERNTQNKYRSYTTIGRVTVTTKYKEVSFDLLGKNIYI